MKQRVLIALTGKAGSGKDTFAGALQQALFAKGYSVYTHSFAGPLKAMLQALGVSRMALTDRVLKESNEAGLEGRSPRYLAQTLGTEWGRNLVSPDVWVNSARRDWERRFGDNANLHTAVILTDARFENEASAVRAAGGVVVHIQRHGIAPVEAHVSEAGIAAGVPGDIRVLNWTTLDAFKEAAPKVVERIIATD